MPDSLMLQPVDDLISRLAGFILDMDGTLYLGDTLLPGAAELLALLEQRGIPYLYLTNNSARDAAAYASKLARLGLPASPARILTSGAATISWLCARDPDARLLVLGTPTLRAEFAAAGFATIPPVDECTDSDDELPAPDWVILGFDQTLTYARLAQACTYIRQGTPWLATHPDINCPVPGGFIPDAGAIAAAIVASTGRPPTAVIGKPNPFIYQEALTRLGTPAQATAMVGDRLYTDIAGARDAGLASILVLSGETTRADLETATVAPDLVLPSVQELAACLARQTMV